MNKLLKSITFISLFSISSFLMSTSFASDTISPPMIGTQIFDKAKANTNWKVSYATGKHAQVVFMSVSPDTNPKNEIGVETHPFDQVIFVASGNGTAVLAGVSSPVKAGDMIFIPLGTEHNVINKNAKTPLKIISVYSDTDIPANTTYKKKSDQPAD